MSIRQEKDCLTEVIAMSKKQEKNSHGNPFTLHKIAPASHKQTFTDEEAKVLENDFIEAYSGDKKSTLKILLIMYKRYPLQLAISIIL